VSVTLPGIVGRDEELAAVTAFVDGDLPTVLVLDGEAGIGKTTLFEAAVSEARERGFAVFSCRPAGAEAAFSFAALADLLRPVLPEGLAWLPSPQRRALAAALLLEDVEGSAPDERAIAFAVFQLLREDRSEPLLVAVDDAQWLDPASASVLGFALRRLTGAPAAILIARRSDGSEAVPLGLERAFPDERLRRLRLGPLSVGATHRLLRERLGVSFRRHTLLQLHQRSGGSPFYALEFARALERSGDLTIPASLTGLVSARLTALPEDVREALEPIALLGEPTISVVGQWRPTATVLERLREAKPFILELDDDERIRFSHPLLAAQIESELDPRRRRLLHRRLAKLVGDVEQRARHLALGVDKPSTRVADELETASAVAASRGASGAAAELAELSLSLTPTTAGEGVVRRRQLLAADHHYASGDVERLRAILEPLVEQLPPGAERARVLRRLGESSVTTLRDRATPRAGVQRGRDDARLKAEIVTPRVMTAFLRHGRRRPLTLGARLGSGRGGTVTSYCSPSSWSSTSQVWLVRHRSARACARLSSWSAPLRRTRRRSSRGCACCTQTSTMPPAKPWDGCTPRQ
jgi:hypothetical protein